MQQWLKDIVYWKTKKGEKSVVYLQESKTKRFLLKVVLKEDKEERSRHSLTVQNKFWSSAGTNVKLHQSEVIKSIGFLLNLQFF